MGYLLRRALADVLPISLTQGERLVALEVADQANDDTGIAYGPDLLAIVARRAGFANAKQVGRILGELALHGLELRRRIGTDSKGRPLFACRGHATTYDVGSVAVRLAKVPTIQDLLGRSAYTKGPDYPGPLSEKGPGPGGERSRLGARKVPDSQDPSPSFSSSTQLASSTAKTKPKDKADRLIDQHAPDLDRATVAQHLAERGKGLGVLSAAERDGTLLDLFATIRAWAAPTVQPPRYADWAQPAAGCGAPGCVSGKVEDPANDYRPKLCPACQPQPVNGHHR